MDKTEARATIKRLQKKDMTPEGTLALEMLQDPTNSSDSVLQEVIVCNLNKIIFLSFADTILVLLLEPLFCSFLEFHILQ